MSDLVQSIQLNGKSYVVLARHEYDRLKLLEKAESLPELPTPDENGAYPAVEYSRISLARKIIIDRAELGLSQAELANLAGIRVETLCRIETGKVTPSIATMQRIEQGFQRAERAKSRRRHASAKRR